MLETIPQHFEISNCVFQSNYATPIVDLYHVNQQSNGIFIEGGFRNIIKNVHFMDNNGKFADIAKTNAPTYTEYFP